MAGANLEFDDSQVIDALNALIAGGQSLAPFFGDVGEYLLNSHDARWEAQIDPDGNPWAELDPKTKKAKQRKGKDHGILIFNQYLKQLHYQSNAQGLLLGTNKKYGATHQFGDNNRNIPARPYLGFSRDDRDRIPQMLSDFLEVVLN